MSSCLFGFYKSIYIICTFFVLLIHILYLYNYAQKNFQQLKSLFSQNQFAHFMGILLGLLFRLSGFLSACKEKIALTFTYSLLLILILILSRQIDNIFALHLITAVMALLYVLILKYRRSNQKRAQQRNQPFANRANDSSRIPARHVSFDLIHGPGMCSRNSAPSAPPFETIHNIDPILSNTNSISNHTPPPSYTELFDSK